LDVVFPPQDLFTDASGRCLKTGFAYAAVAEHRCPLDLDLIARRNAAALAGRQVFDRVEAVDADIPDAARTVVVKRVEFFTVIIL